jgi:carbonic anhydrase
MSKEQPPFVCSADDALARLIVGQRAVRERPGAARTERPGRGARAGQRPFATVLGCSDSRVPPELLFDVGFGELFVIRVAGNVILPAVMGSIQYAASTSTRRSS